MNDYKQVEPLIKEVGLIPGIIELYTPEEAANDGIVIQSTTEKISSFIMARC